MNALGREHVIEMWNGTQKKQTYQCVLSANEYKINSKHLQIRSHYTQEGDFHLGLL